MKHAKRLLVFLLAAIALVGCAKPAPPPHATIYGARYQQSADVLTTLNQGTISGLAQTIDGVALSTPGARVWLVGQTTFSQDGCYLVASGTWLRCDDVPVGYDAAGDRFTVKNGTSNSGPWTITNPPGSGLVGVNDLTASSGGGGGGGAVSSVYGRTGAVTAQSDDYTPQQVRALPGIVVQAATTASLPTYTKTGTGVGATLTATSNGAFPSIDGQSLTASASEATSSLFLLNNPAAAADGGVYSLAQQGDGSNPWIAVRYTGLDSASEIKGSKVRVLAGVLHAGAEYTYVASAAITMGTTGLFWLRSNDDGQANEIICFREEFAEPTFTANAINYGNGLLYSFASGTSTATTTVAANDSSTMGVASSVTGSTATGRVGFLSSFNASPTLATDGFGVAAGADNAGFYLEFRVAVPVLSTGTDEYALIWGLGDTVSTSTTTPANGVYMGYSRPTSTKWQFVVSNASTPVRADCQTVVAGTYDHFVLKKDPGDTTAHGWEDGTECGTGTSGLPTSTILGMVYAAFKSAGTTSVNAQRADFVRGCFSLPQGRAQ